jgi:predicted lipid-binding transport protein (Tim44 family)
MLIASLYAPEGGWLKRLAGALLEGVSLGTLDAQAFAPATGYISFFTLALYVGGLILLPSAPESEREAESQQLITSYQQLSPAQRQELREAINKEQAELTEETVEIRASE